MLFDGGWHIARPLVTLFQFVVWAIVWGMVVIALSRLTRLLHRRLPHMSGRQKTPMVFAAAIAGCLLACSPVIFLGQSFLAPNNGPTSFFYDGCPTVPAQTDCRPEATPGADTGAMDWYFFPITSVGERAVNQDGEFPLWNRYGSAGVSIIGQGQAMIGDPFTWLQWAVGTDAWSFDVKFVLLRVVFATALGLSVLATTGAAWPSMLTAFAANFIGFFNYRVNHTEIFTICYAPLITLCWIKLVHSDSSRQGFWWLAGLLGANWLVLNSGTAKEAYMAIAVLNAAGALHFLMSGRGARDRTFLPFLLMLAISGVCFAAMVMPVFGLFLEGLANGRTAYDAPAALQFSFYQALLFADPLVHGLLDGRFAVASNSVLLIGCLAALLTLLGPELAACRGAAISMTIAAAVCFALGFGIVPEDTVLAIPFVRNIVHLQSTFGAILLVPTSVLAGLGFHVISLRLRAGTGGKLFFWLAIVFLALCLGMSLSFAWQQPQKIILLGALLVFLLIPAFLVVWLLLSIPGRQMNFAGAAACTLAMILALGRGADFPPTSPTGADLLFEPGQRVSLITPPGIVTRLKERIAHEPARVIGVGDTLVPGYSAALGLENISGPDAVQVNTFRQLTDALGLPYVWGWWMYFDGSGVERHAAVLDLLGVRHVFSSNPVEKLQSVDQDLRVMLYERKSAWPRAYFSDRVETHAGLDALAVRIKDGHPTPFVSIAVSDDMAMAQTQVVRALNMGAPHIIPATNYVLTANTTRFRITAPSQGVVYLGEVNIPGDFTAILNGGEVPIFSANHAFKGIVLPGAGTYDIQVSYWPAHLKTYLTLAAAGALTWLLSMILFWLYLGDRDRPALQRTAAATPGASHGGLQEMQP